MSEEIRKGDPELLKIADSLKGTDMGELTREIAEREPDPAFMAKIHAILEAPDSDDEDDDDDGEEYVISEPSISSLGDHRNLGSHDRLFIPTPIGKEDPS